MNTKVTDLTALKNKRKPVLTTTSPSKPKQRKKRNSQELTERIQVLLSKEESNKLTDLAGDIPLSKFVRKIIQAAIE